MDLSELFLPGSFCKDVNRNINVQYTMSYPIDLLAKDIFTFLIDVDAKPKTKIKKEKQQMPPPWGGNADICCIALPSVTVSCRSNSQRQSLGHKALSPWQEEKTAHSPVWAKHSLNTKTSLSHRGYTGHDVQISAGSIWRARMG